MSNPALPIESTPQKRLEANVVAYVRTVFSGADRVAILGTADPEQEPGPLVRLVFSCMVDETEPNVTPLNIMMACTLTLVLTSHPTVVSATEHQEAFQRLRESLFNDPPQYVPGQPIITATRNLLNAVNFMPGSLNARPQSRVHLFDVFPAGESVGPSDNGTMASVLELTAYFGGWDWESATPYP